MVKPVLNGVSASIIDYKRLGSSSEFALKVFGKHNRNNAEVALAVSSVAEIDHKVAMEALNKFSGTWRRFDYKGALTTGSFLYDDYAHHPTEIMATLNGAREAYPKKNIVLVFQPHLYSRTKLLLDDFAEALSKADRIIVADIYASREKNDGSITSEELVKKIKEKNENVLYISDFEKIGEEIMASTNGKDIVITMGAGDIYKVGEKLLDK